VEEPEIAVVVELRLGRAGVLAAEDPKLTAALTRDDSLEKKTTIKKYFWEKNLFNCFKSFDASFTNIVTYFLT
jgi:hypothetical protein